MLSKTTWMGISLPTPNHTAVVRFIGDVHVHVLFAVRAVGESTVAAGVLALKRSFSSVSSFVDFQIF